jgi:hypothetical protein
MKKFFAFLSIVVLLGVVFILVAGLFIPKDYHFERNIIINAPREEVWKNVSLFSNFERWDPWKVHDLQMKRTIESTDGMPGATYSWVGNSDVGSGSQTFTKLVPYEYVGIDLILKRRFEIKAKVFYRLEPVGQRVKVTWGFDSKFPYPMNGVMRLFMNMDDDMDADFEAGLANLKKLCESNRLMTAFNY